MKKKSFDDQKLPRRSLLKGTAGMIGLGAAQAAGSGGAPSAAAASPPEPRRTRARELMRITRLETFLGKRPGSPGSPLAC